MDNTTTTAARSLTMAIGLLDGLSQSQAQELLDHLDAAYTSVVITGDEMPEVQRVAGLDDLNLEQMEVIAGVRGYLGARAMDYDEVSGDHIPTVGEPPPRVGPHAIRGYASQDQPCEPQVTPKAGPS